MFKRSLLGIGGLILMAILAASCGLLNGNRDSREDEGEIYVAAASSLRFAFEEIGEVFEEKSGAKVVFQFGSSGNLAHQIANGAPIDIFASANTRYIEELIEGGHIDRETRVLYALGRVVLAVNKNTGVKVKSLEDLLSDDIKCIALANPEHAPYGLAAKEALVNTGLWELVEDKIVYGETVSQALQFVQTGNAQVGIIALSIADVDGIDYYIIDRELHSPLEQIMGVVSTSENKELTNEFIKTVNSSEGRRIIEEYGFSLP